MYASRSVDFRGVFWHPTTPKVPIQTARSYNEISRNIITNLNQYSGHETTAQPFKVPPRSPSDKVWGTISGSWGMRGLSAMMHGDSGTWAFWKCQKQTLRAILSLLTLSTYYGREAMLGYLKSISDGLSIYPLLQRYLAHLWAPCIETWAGGVEEITEWQKHPGFS